MGKGLITSLCQAPLEVADSLNKALYQRFRTLVMTSATLAVAGAFGYFHSRVGLDRVEPGRLRELALESPFDYQRQALVAIPTDLPEPGRPNFAAAVRDAVEKAVLCSQGRSFVLFTSYALLRQVHDELAPVLQAQRLHCLRQGQENRHRAAQALCRRRDQCAVRDRFLLGRGRCAGPVSRTSHYRPACLLRCRLSRSLKRAPQAIEQRGGDPFMEYTVPQAVIRFKQGFGRLIRHRNDRGVVLILDTRVVKKGYGRMFLRSLPPARTIRGDSHEVFRAIGDFFKPEQTD